MLPQIVPLTMLCPRGCFSLVFLQWDMVKDIAIKPMIILIQSGLTCETKIAPIMMPIIDVGIVINRVILSYDFLYVQTATRSNINNIGISTAAACIGDATIAINGTASTPSPVRPP